jgi:long-chain acyl-CoA synthetase
MANDTLASLFWSRIETRDGRDAQLVKRDGAWRRLTWSEVGDVVREVAFGLLALGRRPGDTVAILAASRAEWVQADFAALSAGCTTVPIYPTYTPQQIAAILSECETRTLIVENLVQLSRVLEVRDKLPDLEQIVLIEGHEAHTSLVLTWEELRRRGRAHAETRKSLLAERVASIQPGDVATIVYTSGTTGEPKGVVQTHANHLAALAALEQIPGVEPGDVHLLFLPLAHSFGRLEAFMGVHRGLVTAFAESPDTLGNDLREVRPDFIFAVPRVFEKAHGRISATVAAESRLRRWLFARAMRVGREVSRLQQTKQPIPTALELARRVADRLVFSNVRRAFGGRLRFAVSGGAALSQEVAEFFHAIGILIVEGYGLTESCPALTFNRIDDFKFGSVGQAIPGVELRIAADGEILARGPSIATGGYFKRPEDTAHAFDADGWFRTGDIGHLDDEGFLHLTDRKKDLIVTSGGINIAPQLVEQLLRRDAFVGDAMVYGDRRPYPTALIALNREEVARFARQRGLLVPEYAQLTQHPEVMARVKVAVDAANAQLQSYAQVKRFAVIPGELTEAGGELTPTQKMKRTVVAAKYRALLEALYSTMGSTSTIEPISGSVRAKTP